MTANNIFNIQNFSKYGLGWRDFKDDKEEEVFMGIIKWSSSHL